MHNDNEIQIEYSPLCGDVTRDGMTVRLQIYRIAGRSEGWSLEVVDHKGTSTVWDDLFATEQDAYAAFIKTLATDGIHSFSEEATGQLH